ncbi:MAG: CRISPR-associated endonuclease Cas1 [Planctomycetia bacterium]|nr:CRISPR-associated endonuclease Cas1 [Planctomycetia bacterium]
MTMAAECGSLTEVPELIPARMLNEFAYCPRLAYLEWVQGEFTDNLETLEGRFGHRRVDRPTRGDVPGPAQSGASGDEASGANGEGTDDEASDGGPTAGAVEAIHSRSLMLSAPGEGLIAKMDLVDINAATAIPVDYKRGRVPEVSENAWEPERVQLCAQGLILRENGYHCEGGILYFIESRRRVSIPFDDELVDRTRELIRQMREMAVVGVLPAPLADSPKCPRCSLVGICLPDETCLLTEKAAAEAPGVRRLMPARDDALPLYLQEQGTTLGKSGDELTVKRRQEVLQKVKLLDVSQVCVFGNVQITAQALREIAARSIPVCHFSYGGWFHAATVGMTHKNVELRIRQFATAADPGAALALARAFVVGKIKNARTLLRRHLDGDSDRALARLAELAAKADSAADALTLLGLEGTAAVTYFAGLASLFKGDVDFHLDGRNRRPPRDPVNALLSFVYALLVKELTVTLFAVGFDPMLGFYHRPRYGRPSLALDLAEEFRPLIGDSVVLMLVNNGEVTPSSFVRRAGAIALTTAGRRAVIAAFERRMDTLVTHPVFGYRISYRRILEVQSRLLARTVLGEIERYPSFCTR